MMAFEGRLQPDWFVIERDSGDTMPATAVPFLSRHFEALASMNSSNEVSLRYKGIAVMLALVLGPLGVHRFYLGLYKTGLAMAVLSIFGGLMWNQAIGTLCLAMVSLWSTVDLVKIGRGKMLDGDGLVVE